MNQELVQALEDKINKDYHNIAGVVVLKNGDVHYEKYFHDCHAKSRIHIYSVTKSIMSLLIGIAIDKGYIKSVDQKVLEFFPDYTVKRKEKRIQDVTLFNLLTMTAPYKYRFAPYIKYFTSDDFVHFSLDLLGGKGRIGEFRYTPLIGPDILSGILVNATGQSVFDFANEHLFTPLGITVEKNLIFETKEEQLEFNQATDMSGWAMDAQGTNTAGWGLTLSPLDMAKIGQLYLNGGLWEDKQIVSKTWIDASTTKHSRWQKQNLSYGYLWWLTEKGYVAMGDGGNIIYVNTEKQLVVAIAALFQPRVMDRINFIQDYIEPLFV